MKILLLAGTNDSIHIAGALSKESRISVIATLARASSRPMGLGVPTRIGGWGSDGAFVDWLEKENVTAILDATHPFAQQISMRAARVSKALGLDYLMFQRPQWLPGPDDSWEFLNDCSEVARHVPEGATVLIDSDGRGVDALGHLWGRTVHYRLRGPVPGLVQAPHWRYHQSPEIVSVDREMVIYQQLGLDWLVLPNVGGSEDSGKLEAARRLGVRLAIVRRPPKPDATRVATISEVMSWVRRRV